MNFLITGASGKLGREIATMSGLTGHHVTGTLRCREGVSLETDSLDNIIQIDLLEQTQLQAIDFASFDAVFHCAWETAYGTYRCSSSNHSWVERSIEIYERYSCARGGQGLFIAFGSGYENVLDHYMYNSSYMNSKRRLRDALVELTKAHKVGVFWVPVYNIISTFMSEDQLFPRIVRTGNLKGLKDIDEPIFWQVARHVAHECLHVTNGPHSGFSELQLKEGYYLSLSDISRLCLDNGTFNADSIKEFIGSRASGDYARVFSNDLVDAIFHFQR